MNKKLFKKELMALIAKHMKTEIKGVVGGVWEDGPFSQEYEDDEVSLFEKYNLRDSEGDMTGDNYDVYMESFSYCLDRIVTELEKCLDKLSK